MAKTLFDIEQSYLAIVAELEENGGELTPELEEALEVTKENFEEKFKAYRQVIVALEANINHYKDEKNRLNNKQKTQSNIITRLKERMIQGVRMFGSLNPKTGSYGYKCDTLSASAYKMKVLDVDEAEQSKLLQSHIEKLSVGIIPKGFDTSIYNVSIDITITSDVALKSIKSLADVCTKYGLFANITLKPDSKMILARLKNEEKIDYYSIKETDVIKIR